MAASPRRHKAREQRLQIEREDAAKKAEHAKMKAGELAKAGARLAEREASLHETYELLSRTEKKVYDANAMVRPFSGRGGDFLRR